MSYRGRSAVEDNLVCLYVFEGCRYGVPFLLILNF